MRGLLAHMMVTLRLHFRNRQALVYGYIFPLLFMLAFWLVYRNERIPLLRHCGELLTIGILGGACFGLPTTLVSERERGFWRRYRTAQVSSWLLLSGTIGVRYLIMLSVGLLQLLAAKATGVPWPGNVPGFLLAFALAAFAFLGLGLVIAMVADNVSAVQAMGQCLFLPMLVIGGVAVPLASLPEWAQHLSGYFPGRYAVILLQAAFTADHSLASFDSIALLAMGLGGVTAAAFLFRWDASDRPTWRRRTSLLLMAGVWAGVGLTAGALGDKSPPNRERSNLADPLQTAAWERITARDVADLDYAAVPPDTGVVVPIANEQEEQDDYLAGQLAAIRSRLDNWAPARASNPVQAVRNQLSVLATADLLQSPVEGHLPRVVLEELTRRYPKADLIRILTWIAQHPFEGTIVTSIEDLGVPGEVGDELELRLRAHAYAVKFVARLTGRTY
jgi:hypothetical protein